DNYAQRLRSTPLAEDGTDWLWPHANDANEWLSNYGAALYVEDSADVTVRRVKAWRGQNGIVLDRVQGSQVYDNDCSFLSGWGVALWRSSGNVICRNALDFCVRGYSHGVYNRGQDSAGILCFEQSCDNLFALNSATHGGDGFFGFAGKQALGEVPPPPEVARASESERAAWYVGRGCNGNILCGNDFSHAVAHGIEHTFSFDNAFVGNACVGDAICGVWAGYSRRTMIHDNRFESCGDGAYGAERGGVNIEHGQGNRITGNGFTRNKAGVHLWWDEDAGLAQTPWARANGAASTGNAIEGNRFEGDDVAVQLRATDHTTLAFNRFVGCGADVDADAASRATLVSASDAAIAAAAAGSPLADAPSPVAAEERDRMAAIRERMRNLPGTNNPLGARAALGGREAILIGPAGPYDWSSPRDAFDRSVADMLIDLPEGVESHEPWIIQAFACSTDPRTDEAGFQADAQMRSVEGHADILNLQFGAGGPSQLMLGGKPMLGEDIHRAALPADGFGIVATRTLTIPEGCWKIRLLSDDGVRVRMNGQVVHNDWSWHTPKEATLDFALDAPARITLQVEYFELTGHAVLRLALERCASK
ncbi:MAG: right-handed parallel beta-helix repeat-containing protein, partial [Phycisphaerae bacterium]|nr:right-handed parallel beta-helix repeat-containing protein [Phycisphaerae bacterium]